MKEILKEIVPVIVASIIGLALGHVSTNHAWMKNAVSKGYGYYEIERVETNYLNGTCKTNYGKFQWKKL